MATVAGKRVWLVRHGQAMHNAEADANQARRMLDPPLTALGEEQAASVPRDPLMMEAVGQSSQRAELVVVSPLRRTLQTATLAFAATDPPIPMVAHPGLQETNPVPCDSMRPVEAAMDEYPGVDFRSAAADMDGTGWSASEWHVKRYVDADGGAPMPLWPENPYPSDEGERERIDRASADRWREFTSWLSRKPERRIIVVAHHNVFKKALDLCFHNCQVMEFVLDASLQWSLVRGEPALPPMHRCPIARANMGPHRCAVVALGTTNPCKVQAATNGVSRYPLLGLRVQGVKVPSGISEQPTTLEETSKGAKNRAERAAATITGGCRLAMGLESGLFRLDGAFYDVCVCSVYDGSEHHLGFSCAWQLPPSMSDKVEQGEDLAQASNSIGLCSDPSLGDKEGAIGILSGGRINRQAYTEQAVLTALLACNPTWYGPGDGKPNGVEAAGFPSEAFAPVRSC